jgi:hypothetical protein
MAERNAQFLQIGLGHIGQALEIDGILGAVAYWASPISSSQLSIWSLTLTVACSPRPPLLDFPLSSLHILLCARRKRPRRRTAEQRDELAASHVELPPRTSVGRFTATLSLPQSGG